MTTVRFDNENDLVGAILQSAAYKVFNHKELIRKTDREQLAWNYLKDDRGRQSEDSLNRIFDTVDYYENNKRWFGYLLAQPNRNLIFESSSEKINQWLEELLFSGHDLKTRIDNCLGNTAIKGASKGLATLLLYLSDPENYSIWVNKTLEGLHTLKRIENLRGNNWGENYLRFNEAANEFRGLHGFKPREADWILTFIAAHVENANGHFLIEEDAMKHDDYPGSEYADSASQLQERLRLLSMEYPDLDICSTMTELMTIYLEGDRGEIMRLLEEIRARLETHPIVSSFDRLPSLKIAKTRAPGSLPNVPWISILDSKITDSTRFGIYCVYLFKADMSGLYLTYNQGAGISVEGGVAGVDLPRLRSRANEIRASLGWIKDYGFSLDESMDLGSGGPARSYEAGCIAHKYYPLENMPSDVELAQDLTVALEIYAQTGQEYWEKFNEETVTTSASLAHPFSKIFSSRDEAEWAFEIYTILLEGLGVTLPNEDKKAVLTLTGIYSKGGKLNLTYFNWLLLSFRRRKKTGLRVMLTLRDDLASDMDVDAAAEPFHNGGKDLPSCSLYNVDLAKLDPMSDVLRRAIVETMSVVLDRFQNYGNSPFIRFHRAELVTAALDPEYRDSLLTNGLSMQDPPTQQAWIFQGNPDVFDVDTYLQSGDPCYWSVKHKKHQDRMSIGDPVWLWRAQGKKTRAINGIVARGSVGELPKIVELPDEQRYWSEGEERRSEVKVLIKLEEVRLSPEAGMIIEDAISNDPVLADMLIIRARVGTNFPIEPEEQQWIETMWNEMPKPTTSLQPEYTLQRMAEETHIKQSELGRWKSAIERKKQAVFYGPPGTGKTFVAERMANHLVSGSDGFTELVQFHPSYAYEDFIQGLRPATNSEGNLSYRTVDGCFKEFCDKALGRAGLCVLVIDEINRANLSRVFGELMYLLEYRNKSVPLAGGGSFNIPENVRLIGTMNTADRSIALVDHALRRRFAFLALFPKYELLQQYHEKHATGFQTDLLVNLLEKLNGDIDDRNYQIGVSFFLTKDLTTELEHIWSTEIEPYIEEYFFDQPKRVEEYRWEKVKDRLSE